MSDKSPRPRLSPWRPSCSLRIPARSRTNGRAPCALTTSKWFAMPRSDVLVGWCACTALIGCTTFKPICYGVDILGYTLLLSGILESCFLGVPHASSPRNWSIYQQIERKLASEAANHASVTPQGMWCALPLLYPISALLRVHMDLLYI